MREFDYKKAFSRNLGIVSTYEQKKIQSARVGIPGCGGTGGIHALTLARMGVEHFTLADFDSFSVENFNRQVGAKISTLGASKCEVIRDEILQINPRADVSIFPRGITESSVSLFLMDVDVVLDSLDFFAFEARELLHEYTEIKEIPVIIAAPMGLSVGVVTFTKTSMPYQEYFNYGPQDSLETKCAKLAMGLAPMGTHLKYMKPKNVDFKSGKLPSSIVGVTLCAGVAAAEVMKLILGRGRVRKAPEFLQFDAYLGVLRKGTLYGGNGNWWQRIKIWFVMRYFLNGKS